MPCFDTVIPPPLATWQTDYPEPTLAELVTRYAAVDAACVRSGRVLRMVEAAQATVPECLLPPLKAVRQTHLDYLVELGVLTRTWVKVVIL